MDEQFEEMVSRPFRCPPSEQGCTIQPGIGGRGHFVCMRCWRRFVCPGCAPGLERWFAVCFCAQHMGASEPGPPVG